MDKTQLQEMVTGIVGGLQKDGEGGEPPLTQEQIDEQFKVFRPDESVLASMGIEATPERVAAVNDFVTRTVRQAVALAEFQTTVQLRRLATAIAPMYTFFENQKLLQMREVFFSKHKNLKPFEPLLLEIKDRFIRENREFENEDAAFKAVADEAIAKLKQMGINPDAVPAKGGGQSGSTPPTPMPALSGGGQGGSGDGDPGAKNVPNWRQKVYRG